MRFKGIGANPPFNLNNKKTGNGTGGDVNIGKRFYSKGIELLEDNGEYGFIMLKGIVTNLLKEKDLEFTKLNYMSEVRYWDYNTCWFHAIKKSKVTEKLTLSDKILSKVIILGGNPNWYEMNGLVNQNMINSKGDDAVLSIVKLPTSKNGIIRSMVNSSYSKLLLGPKLTATLFDNRLTYLATDEPLCADFCGAYSTRDVQEAEKLKLFVNKNKVFLKIHQVMNTKGHFWTLRHVKPFDISQIVTGEEIPSEWNLSSEDVEVFLSKDFQSTVDSSKYDASHRDKYINHLRHRGYMRGVERTNNRKKANGEVFTHTDNVLEILNEFSSELFIKSNDSKTYKFLDYAAGDGNFISEFVLKLIDGGHSYEEALSKVYGVDIEISNCIEAIKRLYGANGEPVIKKLEGEDIPPEWQSPGLFAVFEVNGKICNIVCADGLKYNYSFGEPPSSEKITEVKKKGKKSTAKLATDTEFWEELAKISS